MASFKTLNNIAGWLVFAIAATALCMAAEPTGSLWDCGEFIAGAYKLQVVHPPGAPIFLLVGRLFAWVGSMISDDPSTIAYAVNMMSALSTAFAAMFICWSTTILSRIALVGRDGELTQGQAIATVGGGVVAGLTTAFCTSIWFSAVEGEVYAMSTFFTCLTLWSTLKWYQLPNNAASDRWLVFAFFAAALSIGVHLLSLLTFPALAMLWYFKKTKQPTMLGTIVSAFIGVLFIVGIQYFIIAGIPRFWASFDRLFVNSFGLPFYSGIFGVFLIFGGAIWGGLAYARASGNGLLQRLIVALGVVIIAYMSYGIVIIRAEANTPINMNDPSDPVRLLPYLNREQYGERPLINGPNFDAKPIDITSEPRYGRVGNKYAVVDEKIDYVYPPASKTFFPRMGDYSQGRPALYRKWINKPSGEITAGDNWKFFVDYQITWMFCRYFMWNFSGRQNGDQGYYAWDPSAGNWITGIQSLDEGKIGNPDELPDFQKNNQANNKYYMIPFLLGLLGFFFHVFGRASTDKIGLWGSAISFLLLLLLRGVNNLAGGGFEFLMVVAGALLAFFLVLASIYRNREAAAILVLFIITGIGITVYSNQPPSEPRERDYVLVGAFFTFAIWVGMAVPALYTWLADRLKMGGLVGGVAMSVVGLAAPVLMLTQNWDDHNRSEHYASRDYAKNFLESCQPNAIIFTYGDNDTYPLWYCQEVEKIRTDVRVVNLSLIAVDWYINQLRRKVNDSPAIAMSITPDAIRGYKRVQIPYQAPRDGEREMSLKDLVKFLGEDHKVSIGQGDRDVETYLPTRKFYIPVNRQEVDAAGIFAPGDSVTIVDTMHIDLGDKTSSIIKDQLAMLDIIANNLWNRPIYWAVTCREDRQLGMEDYLQLEGLGLRLVPVKSRGQGEYGIIGSGRVNTDLAFKNITEKWAWGNFNNGRQFVDKSYLPSLQTMKVTMIRIARQLVVEGKKDKAIALTDKFFEVFPEMNFQYDQFAAYMADVYARSGANDKAAAKIREVASATEQQLRYIKSQDAVFQKAYQQDYQFTLGTVQSLLGSADYMKDEALAKELEDMFGQYMPKNPQMPPGFKE